MKKLIIGLPKGSLQNPTIDLFLKAGYKIHVNSRGYKPPTDDAELEVRMFRAQEIARYVDLGYLDCGITGLDWIEENGADVEVICDLNYSRATTAPTRWVLVVPEDSKIKSVKDLEGKRIATEAVGIVERYLLANNVKADVEYSWGATEVKVPELVDAIVDITETGSSLRANKLRIVDTLMESYPQFICNKNVPDDDWKMEKISKISLLVQGAQNARGKVGLKMNIRYKNLRNIIKELPSLHFPTVSNLVNLNENDENDSMMSSKEWVAIETVIDETVVRDIIPKLKSLGAEGIIEYSLNKVIY